jgi:hypothetical protein
MLSVSFFCNRYLVNSLSHQNRRIESNVGLIHQTLLNIVFSIPYIEIKIKIKIKKPSKVQIE